MIHHLSPRVLFCLGEVENLHLNQFFGKFCLKKLRFSSSILSVGAF